MNLAHKYVEFINRIGSGEDTQGKDASLLFAKDLKKNFNGRWVADSREAFVNDLIAVHKNHGSWKLVPLDVIAARENKAIILRINIESQNIGNNTAIVIFRLDSSNLIKELIEVFSPIQNAYEFEDQKT